MHLTEEWKQYTRYWQGKEANIFWGSWEITFLANAKSCNVGRHSSLKVHNYFIFLVPQQHKHGWLGRFSSAGPAGLSDFKEEMVR